MLFTYKDILLQLKKFGRRSLNASGREEVKRTRRASLEPVCRSAVGEKMISVVAVIIASTIVAVAVVFVVTYLV